MPAALSFLLAATERHSAVWRKICDRPGYPARGGTVKNTRRQILPAQNLGGAAHTHYDNPFPFLCLGRFQWNPLLAGGLVPLQRNIRRINVRGKHNGENIINVFKCVSSYAPLAYAAIERCGEVRCRTFAHCRTLRHNPIHEVGGICRSLQVMRNSRHCKHLAMEISALPAHDYAAGSPVLTPYARADFHCDHHQHKCDRNDQHPDQAGQPDKSSIRAPPCAGKRKGQQSRHDNQRKHPEELNSECVVPSVVYNNQKDANGANGANHHEEAASPFMASVKINASAKHQREW